MTCKKKFINCAHDLLNVHTISISFSRFINHAHNLAYYLFLHVMCAAPYLIFVKYVGDKNYENN